MLREEPLPSPRYRYIFNVASVNRVAGEFNINCDMIQIFYSSLKTGYQEEIWFWSVPCSELINPIVVASYKPKLPIKNCRVEKMGYFQYALQLVQISECHMEFVINKHSPEELEVIETDQILSPQEIYAKVMHHKNSVVNFVCEIEP